MPVTLPDGTPLPILDDAYGTACNADDPCCLASNEDGMIIKMTCEDDGRADIDGCYPPDDGPNCYEWFGCSGPCEI